MNETKEKADAMEKMLMSLGILRENYIEMNNFEFHQTLMVFMCYGFKDAILENKITMDDLRKNVLHLMNHVLDSTQYSLEKEKNDPK